MNRDSSNKNAHKTVHRKINVKIGKNTLKNWRKETKRKPNKSNNIAVRHEYKPKVTLGDIFPELNELKSIEKNGKMKEIKWE